MQLFINNWSAVLTAPAAASAASLSVPLADAAKLAGLGNGDYYLLTLVVVDGNGVETAWEIVKVTAAVSGVLTVERHQEGTLARDWVAASAISARATKGTLESLQALGGTAVGDAAPQPLGVATPGVAAAASREDHVHGKPTAADIGAATAAQGAKADTAVQPGALTSGLAGKVDKDGAKGLSDENYTAAEKAKLAGLEGEHFKGLHASLAALQSAHPSAVAGDYADVDSGTGADVARYIWDVSDSKWVIQSGASGSMTAAQIKTAYESNPDTNAFSDAEQAKLGAIAAGATANATNAELRDRSTHTGTQTASTISDLAAAVRGVVMTGVSFATATAGQATDSMLVFLGKLQAQINGLATAVTGKQAELVSGTNIKTVNGASLLGAGNLAIAGGGVSLPAIRSITGNETLGLASINTFGVNATTSNYTSTIPAQVAVAWTADAELHFLPSNTGDITITAAAGVSLNGVVAGSLTLSTQNGAATLKRVGADAWWLGGVIGTAAEQRDALGLGNISGINRLINGAFQVNQRAVTGTVTLAAGAYGHDRWKAGASGCTYTFATTANVTIITITAGSLQQVIEGLNLQSGTHTLSWSGTAQGRIGAGSYGASGISGAAVGGTNLTVEFNAGTVSLAQFEAGSLATPFGHRLYGQELCLCQRYYETGGGNSEGFFCGAVTSGQPYYYGNTFQVSKRASPTVTLTSALASGFPSTASSIQGSPTTRGLATVRIANATASSGFYADLWVAVSEL